MVKSRKPISIARFILPVKIKTRRKVVKVAINLQEIAFIRLRLPFSYI